MFRSCWVMLFALLLSACGGGGSGGGSGGGDLQVNFNFPPENISAFDTVDLAPQLQGLYGNASNCTVTSGSLPKGLSLDGSCDIVGAATQTGTFNATITLTTPNYSGSLSAPLTLQVYPVQLIAPQQLPLIIDWQEAPSTPIAQLDSPSGGSSGDSRIIAGTVTYQLAPGSAQLPTGLTLNPNTGAVTGIAQSSGTYNLLITATITNSSGVYTVGPTAVSLPVYSGPPLFNYNQSNILSVTTNNPINATPIQVVTPSGTKNFSYSTNASLLPAGVTLNPATGVISGTPVVAGSYNFTVTETVGLADGSTTQAAVYVSMQVNGLTLTYLNQPFPAGPGATQSSITWPIAINAWNGGNSSVLNICTLCDPYSYSLIVAPGSTAPGFSASSPLPSWISISVSSAEITITPPPVGTALGQYNFYVVMNGPLNGVSGASIVSMTPFNVSMQNP